MDYLKERATNAAKNAVNAAAYNFTYNFSRRGNRPRSTKPPGRKEDGMWIGITMLIAFLLLYFASQYMFSASDESFERVLDAYGDEGRKYLEKKYRVDLSKYKKKNKKKDPGIKKKDK